MNMWRWPMLPVLLVLLLAAGGARAGDIVVPRDFFSAGAGTDLREALPHLENKALVAEFLDPGDSGLGKSLGYLLWRELLTAISDQSGAGVILARLPGERRVVDLLRADYHRGAVAIAAGQRARQLLWGQVLEERGAVFVSAQLTLLPQIMGEALTLNYVSNLTGDAEITVTVPRTRYNLALVRTDRTMLFDRPLVTRKTTRLRAGPRRDASVLASVPKGRVLQATDMAGAWFAVRRPDGGDGPAYVDNADVDVPPRSVESDARELNLRAGPGTDNVVLRKVDLDGSYRVLDMRYRSGQGLWYRIALPAGDGWVFATLVRPRFSLPAVHLAAGLIRLQAKRYDAAVREFAQFIADPAVAQSNVDLAAAHRLLAISLSQVRRGLPQSVWRFVGRVAALPQADGSRYRKDLAMSAADQAVAYTPYDPAAYTLRAFAQVWTRRDLDLALKDLDQALDLDRRDAEARAMVVSLDRIVRFTDELRPQLEREGRAGGLLAVSPALRQGLAETRELYAIGAREPRRRER